MKQYAATFKRYLSCDQYVSTQLNEFLEEHPNYKVSKICYNCSDKAVHEALFVVFDVEKEEN